MSLAHLLPRAVISQATDTSDTHVRAVLQQHLGQHWLPLGFYSKKLSETQVNYTTFDSYWLLSQVSNTFALVSMVGHSS
jgi:hypothetical protein